MQVDVNFHAKKHQVGAKQGFGGAQGGLSWNEQLQGSCEKLILGTPPKAMTKSLLNQNYRTGRTGGLVLMVCDAAGLRPGEIFDMIFVTVL